MQSKFPLTELYCEYLLYGDLSPINDWTDELRLQLYKLMKPARIRETDELVEYLKKGYRLAFVTPDFNHYKHRLSNVFDAYPKLKKTDCVSITQSQDYNKIMGVGRNKVIIVVLPNARNVYNLMDNVNWMQKAGYTVIYEATS
jgi:hypothetical protein